MLKTNYEDINLYFDKLNKDESHFNNSNDICTPIGCVKEMVDSIPEDFWSNKNLKILDPCSGNGNFHAYIALKTDLNNLYFNDINKKRIENMKIFFGENINYTEMDFLIYPENEKYDLVVANPPYAKFTDENFRAAKNHNLSRDFILKGLNLVKDNGYLLYIVPNNWMSFADRNKLPKILANYQFKVIDINGSKKWFPDVGSSFTWFLLQKKPNIEKVEIRNHYFLHDVQYSMIDKDVNFIPLYYNDMVRSIFNKTINDKNILKYKIETTSDLHKYTKRNLISDSKTDIYKYRLIHTPNQTVWSSRPHKYQDGYKVFIPLTTYYDTFIDKDCGMTQSIAFIRCSSQEDAEKISKDLLNPIYILLNNLTRYGNFNNIRVLQNFPVYNQINLTNEELEFIVSFNKNFERGIKENE